MTNPMETKMSESVESLMSIMKNDYLEWAKRGESSYRHDMYEEFCDSLDYSIGKKYIKIISDGGVNSFVVNTDTDPKFKLGDVLMAASWNSPARNSARGNVLEGGFPIQWTGPLYLR